MVNVNAVPNMMVWVILILAAFSLSRDRCMDDTTEQPMPSISPMAVIRSQNGEKMFTAANASLPTPCPMKTPSIIVIKDDAEHAQKCRHKHLAEQLRNVVRAEVNRVSLHMSQFQKSQR